MKKIIINISQAEEKINDFLLYVDEKLYTKRKYFLGLFRDIGHYLRLYPILLRSGIIGAMIYWIWNDISWDWNTISWVSIIAKIITATFCYVIVRWLIHRRSYESSGGRTTSIYYIKTKQKNKNSKL